MSSEHALYPRHHDSHGLKSGYVLQRYRVEKELGGGLFGITYLATELESGERVVLSEFLPGDFCFRTGDDSVIPRSESCRESFEWFREKFRGETRLLMSMRHPHLVPVINCVEGNGTTYRVTEFIEGQTFGQWLDSNPQAEESDLRRMMGATMEGLEQVHGKGVLHGDIHPGKIWIRSGGTVVLAGVDCSRSAQNPLERELMENVARGGYSAFEKYQYRSLHCAKTDMYALAAVMVHAMTGKRPELAVDRIVEEESQNGSWMAGLAGRYSQEFLRVVESGYAPKKDDRPGSVSEWKTMLHEAVATPPGQGAKSPWWKRMFSQVPHGKP